MTRVTLDGETVADYAYGPVDKDVVAAADRRTGETLAAFGLSPVFGTMDSVAYARPRPAAHAAVAYSPALKTFEATWRHLVPDALALASLQRRGLPVRGETPNAAPFAHDRPSNALFLPPEYHALNCHVCSASVQSVSVIADSDAVAGEPATIEILINGNCSYNHGDNGPSGPVYRSGSWGHTLSYGDGTAAAAFPSTGVSARRDHVYQAAGTYEVRDDVDCGTCASPAVLGSARASVRVTHPHRFRVQAQIRKELVSAATGTSSDPIPLSNCERVLNGLEAEVEADSRYRGRFTRGFNKVRHHMRSCGPSGCDSTHGKSYQLGNGYHVDFEVHRGRVCLQ